MITVRFLLPFLVLLALPLFASAQSCCQFRKNDGQAAFDKGDYKTAINEWENGITNCSDAAKCPDLAGLLKKAEDEDAWKTASNTNTKAAYREYLKKYPAGRHAADARKKIAPPPPPKPNPVKKETPEKKPAPDNFIRIPGGIFRMGDLFDEGLGDEKPVRDVTLSDFYLSAFELTVAEFRAFITATNYKTDADKSGFSLADNLTRTDMEKKIGGNWKCNVNGKLRPDYENKHPVIHVSWNDAIAYCNWLSEQRGLQKVYIIEEGKVRANWSANGYRLPTEAEWEYAARQGGKKIRFGNGKNIADQREINCDFRDLSYEEFPYFISSNYRGKTVPVGSLNSPNTLGLHDMSGNVWELCWDWYGKYPSSSETNPRGPTSGSTRIVRGGSWRDGFVSCAVRSEGGLPNGRCSFVGFRLARSVR